jgi:hypothetical protein
MVNVDVDFDVTYQDFPYFCEMAIKHAAPVSDGGSGGSAYLRTYTPTLTSPDTPQTYTVQMGDDTSGDAFYAPFTFATNLELSFAIQERTNGKVALVGQSLTAQVFTGSLNRDRTLESAVGQSWAVFFDDTGGTVGNTAYTGVLIAGTWRLPNTYNPHKSIDGTLVYNSVKATQLCPELEITAEVDAAALALRGKYTAGTRQLVRLKSTGSQIHAGTPNATKNKYIQIVGAYRIVDWGVVGGSDNAGVQTVKITLHGEYDAAAGLLYSVAVNNEVDSLP